MSASNSLQRYVGAFRALSGSVMLLAAFPLYAVAMRVQAQVGSVRTLGVLTVLTTILVAGAALAALPTITFELAPRFRAWSRAAVFGGTIANLALIGLAVFFSSPRAAPWPWRWVAGAACAALMANHLRQHEEDRAVATRMLVRAGQASAAIMLGAAPLVLVTAMRDQPYLGANLPPPASPVVAPDAPHRIVLVTFDSLRAESTSLHAPELDTTPALAALAKQSTWYTGCRAAGDRTLISLATILTGVGPHRIFPHVGNRSGLLRKGSLTSLAGHLRPAGYRTLYATMLINPQTFGFGAEFDAGISPVSYFSNHFNAAAYVPIGEVLNWARHTLIRAESHDFPVHEVPQVRATFERAARLLAGEPGRIFLWVHVGAPHDPYYNVDQADVGATLHPERYETVTNAQLVTANAAAARRYKAMYEAYVRFADGELGRFLRTVDAGHGASDTLLIVTSDHGESFEPGHMSHAIGEAEEAVTHVPLVIRRPGQQIGERVDNIVWHGDLTPTIYRHVYRQAMPAFDGVALENNPSTDRLVYTWAPSSDGIQATRPRTFAAYHGRFKLVQRFPEGQRSLFDLWTDRTAKTDVSADHPQAMTALSEATQALMAP